MSDINVTLPDGSVKLLSEGATVRDLAAAIGAGLAKAALAGKINGNWSISPPFCRRCERGNNYREKS